MLQNIQYTYLGFGKRKPKTKYKTIKLYFWQPIARIGMLRHWILFGGKYEIKLLIFKDRYSMNLFYIRLETHK